MSRRSSSPTNLPLTTRGCAVRLIAHLGLLVIFGLAACGGSDSGGASTSAASGAGGQGGVGQGGAAQTAGTGGSSADACDACTNPLIQAGASCRPALDACSGDATCLAWANCVNNCSKNDWSTACLDACSQMLGTSTTLAQALTDCFCSACKSPCSLVCT